MVLFVILLNQFAGRPPIQIALREERIYYTGDFSSFKEYLGEDNVVPVVRLSVPPFTASPHAKSTTGVQVDSVQGTRILRDVTFINHFWAFRRI
jgi:hypothetical protein